jgi:uncharacterized damage-inducible protein DinB
LRKAVTGLTPDQLHARPIPGKWSTLECVAHLADFEPIHASRMKYVIAHDRPLLVDGDEVRFAQSLAYQDRDLDEELAIIEVTRREMTRILQSLPDEAALRVGIHTYRGLVTLQDLLAAAVNHIPHHVKFIEEKRQALGV